MEVQATLKLGYILMSSGQISQVQLELALEQQQKLDNSGQRVLIGQILVKLGFVDEGNLEEKLAVQSHLSGGSGHQEQTEQHAEYAKAEPPEEEKEQGKERRPFSLVGPERMRYLQGYKLPPKPKPTSPHLTIEGETYYDGDAYEGEAGAGEWAGLIEEVKGSVEQHPKVRATHNFSE